MDYKLKEELNSKGYHIVDVRELFPEFNLDEWTSALNDSWTNEKSTYWEYVNLIFNGGEDFSPIVNLDKLDERRKIIEEEALIVDQQFFQLNLEPNYFVSNLSDQIRNMLLHYYPLEQNEQLHLNKLVKCFSLGDFISPQSLADKLCQGILCISDLDDNVQGGDLTVGTEVIKPKKGTLVFVDCKSNLSLGVNVVNDSTPRFMFKFVVNKFVD